ncbi:hypothetical protein ACTQZR_01325 [Catenibacterium mitsuokai]|uniref:hypothetical protein n=1 Tax=Catenibacterium mitsuokai TaxID=100886 RepID=UPI003F8F0BAC
MLNAEKFKDKILSIADDGYLFAIKKNDKGNVIRCCSDMNCQDCIFDDEESEYCGYNIPRLKWLFAEYKEPVKLSRLEYEILKWAKKEGYKYIARTSSNSVFVHTNKPNKLNYCWVSEDGNDEYFGMFNKFFQFVKWEDEEPRAIKDILENCVVVEDESK